MSNKWEVLGRIKESGLVVVVRANDPDEAKKITEACLKGGAAAIEITYTVPGATQVIEELAKEYQNEIIIGAGTILDPETARIALLSGAEYVVSPYLNEETIKLCNRYQVPCMPGVMTVEGVVKAMELGADILKVFPGEAFGPNIIKAIKGPLPQSSLMPTGGVSLDNVGKWIKAGAVAVGAGGSLTASAKTGDYKTISSLAEQFVQKIKEARLEKAFSGS
ncbi:bifunctional 2-keto-4-hydroxyglutarate aldolase/2-keto-3-deoxy-6-phosphogluconate aldolase [Metabacillus sediminilitoris]|uniref:Bifunctional 4-hydroxy-2-oxoglutarate aldolase/2-dehydro-3-deoxy-phosphogluconate aldolase n=1 Tax=Metabacillus sediminilitoris TaxID=2567941 RepID=A0A4V3WFS6_9BACI|nr:bifunctional 2-keto-4-hydroxyglutarate aldolase/2-keto-3-deoxy-6-phosphogluconate aldolase [Metabacillus sediminilitoris]QGQ47774.1 bifunctional 4-hydroxy-2-oxoglutarate aldolase/2-dehydro-3-deoxy-phosphogluconate aldolase [Metabacillus sediminilitoris]THF81113.1 bifunctional 4-hydroxy-2-oxoglutarate aldolase/2-dehydro-3-deoxy-phosphogluconate aldolase [Metabacillus sediminilitoris]